MRNYFLILITLLFSSLAFSQNTLKITGKIIDESLKLPLESATVYFTKAADSTVVDYTISDRNGNFEFKIRKLDYPLVLKVSYNGFLDYKKDFQKLEKDQNLGTILLKENVSSLSEIVVKGETPPIVIKTDTLEFNASSFKVRPDANVEALLKQLPGVEIDENGKITVNGKEVNNILVNGKPFFGKDGKIATQNLPAEMISKIQVTDTKTKEEELSGQSASSDEKTINLTIDEDKNKGLFGKATLGYGTDDRYESSLLFNYFKDTQKISVLGSSNNINSVGFSMDEIFDNMGGGRNTSIWTSGDGSFGINGMRFGGNKGITKSSMIGINFSDEWFNKKIDPNGSYYYNNADSKNTNRTNRTNLLPTGNTNTISESNTRNIVDGHNLNLDFEVKIDSTTTLYISPAFSKTKNNSSYNSFENTYDENGALSNDYISDDKSQTDFSSFKNNLYLFKKLDKKGKGIGVSFNNTNTENETDLLTYSKTSFYQSGAADDERDQSRRNKERSNSYNGSIRYIQPISDSLNITIQAAYAWEERKDYQNTFDFDGFTDDYSVTNDALSRDINSKKITFTPSIALQLRKKKIRGRMTFGTDNINYQNQSLYLGTETKLNQKYLYPNVNGYLSVTLGKSKSIYTYSAYKVTMPSASQLLPYENIENPLNTILGNAELKPKEAYQVYLNFNNYDYASRSGFYLYGGLDYNKNEIVASTTYDADYKATTTYQNIDKTYNSYAGLSYSKVFKKEKRTFKAGTSLDLGLDYSEGLTNAVLYESSGYEIAPRAFINWSIEDLITLNPSYTYTFNRTDFNNYVIDKTEYFKHNFKFELTSYWPKHVVFGSDFGYNYNSNISGGFKRDFYLWNVSLGYNFWNDQLLAKVKVYDLLNQNIGVSRTVTPTAITDTENTVLQQYVMFSLTFKLEKFGGKKKESNMFWRD
jgi:hypothetical protein